MMYVVFLSCISLLQEKEFVQIIGNSKFSYSNLVLRTRIAQRQWHTFLVRLNRRNMDCLKNVAFVHPPELSVPSKAEIDFFD